MPAPARPSASDLRPMCPSDIAAIVVAEELDVMPDGSAAVVARRIVRRGRYETHLWVVDLAGRSRPRQLTTGDVRDGSPVVSPDGRAVAFVRSDAHDHDAPNHSVCASLRTSRVRTLAGGTPGIGSIGEVAWSPDGSRLAFTAAVDPLRFVVGERPVVGTKASRSSKLPSPVARRIARADWRWDDEGHRDRWSHLFVIDVAGGAGGRSARQVTRGDWGVSDITWHPDGRTVAFVADLGDEPDLAPFATDLGGRRRRRFALEAVAPAVVLDAAGGAARPAYSPDGRWLAAVGILDAWPLDDVCPGLLIGPADGSAPAHALGARARSALGQLRRHRPHRLDGERTHRADVARRRPRSSVW